MDRTTKRRSSRTARAWVAFLTFAVVVAPYAGALGQGASDDLFLLTTSVSPNLVLVLDNSGSMDEIEWHEAFDPNAASYGCTVFSNSSTYFVSSEFDHTECGNTRRIYNPATNGTTRYQGSYLNWYFSDEADPYINEINTATADVTGCQSTSGAPYFDDKYRRTRFQAAQQVSLDLLCFAEPKGVRIGLAIFRTAADTGGVDPNGGWINLEIDTPDASHSAQFDSLVRSLAPTSWTPLGETLFQIYTYMMSRVSAEIPDGDDGLTAFPRYQYRTDGTWSSSGGWTVDPIQYSCQRSFVIVITDGEPTRDDFDSDPASTAYGFSDFDDLIGDYHNDSEVEEPGDSSETAWYLDDIALYMQSNDMRPDLDGDQLVDIYTVGFSTGQLANDLLRKTADVGNGNFSFAQTGDQLAEALDQALNDIIEKSQSFTAASVPSARTQDGGDFYQSFFFPLPSSAFWEGHLRSWHITAAGDVTDKNDDCALDDPDVGECNSGPFLPSAVYFWDAFDGIPAPASRNLMTSKLSAGPGLVDFTMAQITADDLGIQDFTSPTDVTPNNPLYPLRGSTANAKEGLADEIVQYARGCIFGTGVSDVTVDTPSACAPRAARLGDIFHSNPAVVRQPLRTTSSNGNAAFRDHYSARSRVIYAGTNGGFLEAFAAGTWDSLALPPAYDEGTGAEIFGFMPWSARQNIRKQPVDAPIGRTYYVDGSPQVADAWLYTSPTANEVTDGSEWRTVLVGGLRQGGRSYYALDVTNPDGIGPIGGGMALPYPGYLWEFPREDDPNIPTDSNSYLPFMGETWGQPIITRIKVKVGADDNFGYGYTRWVAIVTGGFDPTGNPNDTANYDPSATAGRSIYVIDLKTGKPIAEKRFDASASDDAKYMYYSIPATPSVFDLNNDGYADMVVVGDLGGQVFKWMISEIAEDRANDASNLRTQPAWTFKRFFAAPTATIGLNTYYKSIFFPPAAAYAGGFVYYAFGTGERAEIAFPGDATSDTENNRYYVVRDEDLWERNLTPNPTLTESDLTDLTGVTGTTTFTTPGFFLKGVDGEKWVTNTEIFKGTVIAASFTPDFTGDPCTSRGTGTIYAFDILTGEGYFSDGLGNPARSVSGGSGMPTDPKTSTGPDGKDNRVYVEKSDTSMLSFGAEDLDLSKSGLYWREQ